MFNLDCNDKFVLENIRRLLIQKNFPLAKTTKKIFATISFKPNKNTLSILFDNKVEQYTLPVSFNLIINSLINNLSDININYQSLDFFPFMQMIKLKNNQIKLRNNHSLILYQLILNKKEGIHKNELYRLIWPNDFEIQINKLDTHLTNLKNFLKNEIGFDLSYSSTDGLIKLN